MGNNGTIVVTITRKHNLWTRTNRHNKAVAVQKTKHPLTNPGSKERQDIARDINENSNRIGNLRNTGQLSGRDDYAGGSGDDMSAENTNEPTDS